MVFRDYENLRVLIVDDQKEIHDDFVEMLTPDLAKASSDQLAGAFLASKDRTFLPEFELLHATSGEEACEIIKAAKESNRPVAVAYIDIRMPPGIDGIETVRRVRKIDRDLEVVIMTAYTDKSLPEIIHNMELLHKLLYIRKPFAREEIQQITFSLAGKWNVEQELAEKRRQLTINHQRLEAVLDATGDAMAMYDTDEHLVFANRGYERMLDLSKGELEKLSTEAFMEHFHKRFREPDLPDVERGFLIAGNGSVVKESEEGKVPRQRLFYRSAAPVHDTRGGVIGRAVRVPRCLQGDRGREDEGRSDALAHRAGEDLLLLRHGGRQRPDEAGVRAGEAGRRKRHHGAHPRRERNRQGTGREVLPLQQLEKAGAVSGHQLRRHPRSAHRERTVRTRKGSFHRGGPAKNRSIRARQVRNGLSRRGRRHAAVSASQAVACPARAGDPADRRIELHTGRCAGDCGNQQGPRVQGEVRRVSRRSVLPHCRFPPSWSRRCGNAGKTFLCWRNIFWRSTPNASTNP